jgi:uncharacterized membrane protein YkoI
MRRKAIVITAASVALVGAGWAGVAAAGGGSDPAAERQAEAAYTEAHRTQVPVSQSDAESAALAVHPGAIVDVHLQDEGQGLRWEVKADDGTRVWEVQVDATSGRVVSNQPDD